MGPAYDLKIQLFVKASTDGVRAPASQRWGILMVRAESVRQRNEVAIILGIIFYFSLLLSGLSALSRLGL